MARRRGWSNSTCARLAWRPSMHFPWPSRNVFSRFCPNQLITYGLKLLVVGVAFRDYNVTASLRENGDIIAFKESI
ncbi:MAG: hypothetical protein O3B11_03685 [Bacteroidetes bacterium]|nr:hypothetical protein [Bacteroidota bacterium]